MSMHSEYADSMDELGFLHDSTVSMLLVYELLVLISPFIKTELEHR